MEFVASAALVAVIWKAIDFLKALRNAEWNTVVTQAIVWVGAIAILFLFRETSYAATISIGGSNLGAQTGWDVAAVGLAFGSAASATFDIKKSIDNTDSATVSKFVK